MGLYKSAELHVERNFSAITVQESKWLLRELTKKLGDPNLDIQPYQESAVFTSSRENFKNLENLRSCKIRLYTEVDPKWWKENRGTSLEQTNAYYLEQLAASLHNVGFSKVEYITSTQKGYRANGERHPHSWSIVDKEDLFQWMLQ